MSKQTARHGHVAIQTPFFPTLVIVIIPRWLVNNVHKHRARAIDLSQKSGVVVPVTAQPHVSSCFCDSVSAIRLHNSAFQSPGKPRDKGCAFPRSRPFFPVLETGELSRDAFVVICERVQDHGMRGWKWPSFRAWTLDCEGRAPYATSICN